MILYKYTKEDSTWSREKLKTLEPGTPEYKFYEKFNFIEEKWFETQELLKKFKDRPAMHKVHLKKLQILEREYTWLKDFSRPTYDVNDTIEDMKRMNVMLVNFIEEIVKANGESNSTIEDIISKMELNIKENKIDLSSYTKEETIELINRMI